MNKYLKDEGEFIFTYNYDKESGVYSTDYGFGLDAPKETEQTNPQDLFAYRRNYTWTYKSKTAMLFLTTYNNFLTQQTRKGLNEKNLLTKSSDKNYTVHYRYGEDGQRALKYTEEGRSETLYFNNFFTIHIPIYDKDNPQGLRVHKHIFVGNSRLVTAMTHTDNHGDNDEQREKRYYYHSDHLGSAQFVTDWRGKQYEHIEYTPYGELWVEETAPGIDKLPFRFTGKELDEETGLYYYGARYLDPKYSRWLSGDPALNDYIPQAPIDDEAKKHNENLPGMGGVFNTVNLHVYHYAGNNPVKYTDPDGRDTETVKETIKISIDLGKQLAPLFEKPNPNNLMTEAMAINKANDIKGLLTNMADLAKKDLATFVATLALEGLCAGIALDSGLVDSIIDLKERGIDIMGMNFSGSMNLSSSENFKYAVQFQPSFGDSFNLGVNLTGNLNKTIGDKHSLSFGISTSFTIPSKPMPNMQFSFLYTLQL